MYEYIFNTYIFDTYIRSIDRQMLQTTEMIMINTDVQCIFALQNLMKCLDYFFNSEIMSAYIYS